MSIFPDPPLAGHPARIMFRRLDGSTPGSKLEFRAVCEDCQQPAEVRGVACLPDCRPDLVTAPGARYLHLAGEVTLPLPGHWRFFPGEILVRARATRGDESPRIVVRTDSTQGIRGCATSDVTGIVAKFIDSYNRGDVAAARDMFEPNALLAVSGRVAGTDEEIAGVLAARHQVGEAIKLFYLEFGINQGLAEIFFVVTRSAPDLGGEQVAHGKAQIRCSSSRIVIWTMTRAAL